MSVTTIESVVIRGKRKLPLHVILYGVHGIGKTTFGASSPSPIFITGEEIEEIDAPKFPKCESWGQFVEQLTMIRDQEHDFKSLVIDTVDSIEMLLWNKIIEDDPKAKDMATACGGYGKAYVKASQMFTEIRDNYLVPIREKRNMNIILLAHASRNKVEDVFNHTSYDTYEMKLHKTSKGYGTYTVFCEWVSTMLFANFKVNTLTQNGRDFAIGDGERVMYCTPRPAYDAKNRFDLPDELPMSFSALQECVDNFYEGKTSIDPEQLREEIKSLLVKVEDEGLRKQTEENVNKVGNDVNRLLKARDYIRGIL